MVRFRRSKNWVPMSTQTEGAPEVKEEPAARVPVPSPEKVVTFKVSSRPRVSPPSPPKMPPLSPEKLGMDEAWVESEGERVRAAERADKDERRPAPRRKSAPVGAERRSRRRSADGGARKARLPPPPPAPRDEEECSFPLTRQFFRDLFDIGSGSEEEEWVCLCSSKKNERDDAPLPGPEPDRDSRHALAHASASAPQSLHSGNRDADAKPRPKAKGKHALIYDLVGGPLEELTTRDKAKYVTRKPSEVRASKARRDWEKVMGAAGSHGTLNY